MHKLACKLALLAAAMLPLHAVAAYECNVSVNRILVYADGTVNVWHSGRGDYTVICNMSADYSGVSVKHLRHVDRDAPGHQKEEWPRHFLLWRHGVLRHHANLWRRSGAGLYWRYYTVS